jgi:hypothetical protein
MVSRIFTCLPSSLVAGSLSNLVFMIVKRWRTECQLALGGGEGLLKLARRELINAGPEDGSRVFVIN